MSSEWKKVTVEDIASSQPAALSTGPFGSSIGSKHFTVFGVPVIRGSNLSSEISTRLNDDGLVFVSPEKAKEFQRSIVRKDDLVFTCWGTINQVGYIDDGAKFLEYIVSNKQMKLTLDKEKAYPLYIYYVFSGPEKQREILDNGIGSSVPGFNLGQLKKHEIFLPPLTEQKSIAALLGNLDDRITLLRETNATLEAIAQALFKSWFVDFDPVHAKQQGRAPEGMDAATAVLFPDSFEESELGMVPKGWTYCSLKDVTAIFDSKRVPLSGAERSKRQGVYPYYGAASLMDYVNDYIFDGIYLLIGGDGSVANASGYPITQYVWGKFWVNNHAHILQGKNGVSTEHLMLSMQQTYIQPYITGAVQAKLSQSNMWRINFLNSGIEISEAFGKVVSTLYESLRMNSEHVKTLATLRDTLLPRLISGQLRLPEAQALVEEATAA